MSKIIFLDVDGTLVDYQTRLPQSAKLAVDLARKNGHKVYICTGCSKYEILSRPLPELDGMIGANGGYVEDNGKVILHQSLSPEEERHIVDWCTKRHLGFYLESNNGLFYDHWYDLQNKEAMTKYAFGKGKSNAEAERIAEEFLADMVYLEGDNLYRDDINKISYILSSYQDFLDSQAEFPTLEANTWGGKGEMALFGDLGPSGITKRHAIEVLLEHLGADHKDTIAFGDAKIDLSMFELCAYNVAMGNGGPEIKAAADYVTGDVNEDGLYNAFQYLKLI